MRLTVILFLMTLQSADAQRVWGLYEGNIAGDLYSVLTECVDTTIDGKTWQKIESKSKFIHRNWAWWPQVESFVRNTNGLVLYRDIQGFETVLYNYNLQIGDTIRTGVFSRNYMVVYDRDTINLLGRDRIQLKLREDNFDFEDEWIEGIGSTYNKYFSPGEPPNLPDGGSWSVSFTEDGGNTIYKRSDDSLMSYLVDTVFRCSISTSVLENKYFQELLISNPIDDLSQLKIYGLHEPIENVKLISVDGSTLFDGDMKGLMTTKIKSGLFILVVQSSHKTYLNRLIVQ